MTSKPKTVTVAPDFPSESPKTPKTQQNINYVDWLQPVIISSLMHLAVGPL